MSFVKPTDRGSILNFIQSRNLPEHERRRRYFPHIIVTLNEGQNHSQWYQNVEFSDVFRHAKFERKKLICNYPNKSQCFKMLSLVMSFITPNLKEIDL